MKLKTWLFLGIAVVVVGGGSYWYFGDEKEDIKWRFAQVDRGDIRQRVSATGTLSALLEVDVGTQVSGMVTSLNADYNSIVKKDQVIATIDPTIPSQQVRTEEINVERSLTSLDDAERQFKRYQALAAEKLVSAIDLESREVAYRTAKASYDNALISLERAKANLGYCTIKAPVDGVVVSRKADVGQTVTASMSTPSLFIIAQDLSKMKLEITIDEADIAQVNVGQRANFTVDSIPDTQFSGTVSQVRLEPITTQNVVSYKVVVEVQNQTKQEIETQKERRQAMMSGNATPQGGNPGVQGLRSDNPGGISGANTEIRPGQPTQNAERRQSPGREATTPSPQPSPQASSTSTERPARGEGRPGAGDRQGGTSAFSDGPVDYDAMWERVKDMVLERQPDITKDAWIRQAKERQVQMGQQGGGRPDAPQQGGRQTRSPQQITDAATASGLIKAGGPFYQGEYVLRPGMTANVTIITNQKNAVLRVPNNALRFNPAAYIKDDTAPGGQAGQQQRAGGATGGAAFMAGGGSPDRRSRLMDRGIVARREDRVWVLDEKRKPKGIVVNAGLTDGQFTEVTAEEISEGTEILIGVDEVKKNAPASGANPFQMGGGFGGGRR